MLTYFLLQSVHGDRKKQKLLVAFLAEKTNACLQKLGFFLIFFAKGTGIILSPVCMKPKFLQSTDVHTYLLSWDVHGIACHSLSCLTRRTNKTPRQGNAKDP